MANNVVVRYDETDGMLHFIVDPTMVVGETKSGSEYVCQSERYGEDVPGAPGWKFNLAVWIKPGAAVVQAPAPVVVKRQAAPFVKAASVPASKGIAPGEKQTVAINRVRG